MFHCGKVFCRTVATCTVCASAFVRLYVCAFVCLYVFVPVCLCVFVRLFVSVCAFVPKIAKTVPNSPPGVFATVGDNDKMVIVDSG